VIRDKFVTKKSDMHRLKQQDIDESKNIYSYLKKNRKRIVCFWIPSTRLNRGEISSLDSTVLKIINRIISRNSANGWTNLSNNT
jgi:excinuclease ABC subunit C